MSRHGELAMCCPPPFITAWMVLALLCSLATCEGRQAQAEVYVEGFGNLSFARPIHSGVSDQYGPVTDETKPGGGFGARVGGYGEYLGAELEAMHMNAPIKSGHLCTWFGEQFCNMLPGRRLGINSLGVNGLVRYPGHIFEPYIGIGLAYLQATLGPDDCANGWRRCGPLGSAYADSTQEAATVGYVFKAGVLWKWTSHWGMSLTYEVQKAKFQFSGASANNCCDGFGETLDAGWQTVQIGLRYTF